MVKCEKHPKYKGNKPPDNECVGCLNLYIKLKTPRAPIKPTQVIKDKKKYTRKKKHKKSPDGIL